MTPKKHATTLPRYDWDMAKELAKQSSYHVDPLKASTVS